MNSTGYTHISLATVQWFAVYSLSLTLPLPRWAETREKRRRLDYWHRQDVACPGCSVCETLGLPLFPSNLMHVLGLDSRDGRVLTALTLF